MFWKKKAVVNLPYREIFDSLRANDVDMLKKLCEGHELTSFSETDGSSHWLSDAMEKAVDLSLLRAFIGLGVDARALPLKGGISPLNRAIKLQRVDYVDFLLEIGVEPNNELKEQRYTLAAVGSAIEPAMQITLLERLIKAGVDLNFGFPWFGNEKNKVTVLDHARDEQVKAFLRSHGAKTWKELTGEVSQASSGTATRGYAVLDEVIQFMGSNFGPVEAKSFTDILNAGSGITVHVIQPKSADGCITLFTTGLSLKRMKLPPGGHGSGFGEVFLQLPHDWDLFGKDSKQRWPIQMLLDLAAYPASSGAYFQLPVTVISNGEPPEPLDPSVPFNATALLTEKDFTRTDGKTVYLHRLMPIYQAEAKLAIQSVPDFLKALDREGVSRIVVTNRKSVV